MTEQPPSPVDDSLLELVELWRRTCADLLGLVRDLPRSQWDRPTDLPGWSVRDNVAHVAHLEAVLAGAPEESVAVPDAPHLTGAMSRWTEQGVPARRDRDLPALAAEIEDAVERRHAALRADPPTDGAALPSRTVAGARWDTRTLLGDRPFDAWMHEQDIRRAGRATRVDDRTPADATVELGPQDFVVLAGGRRTPERTTPRMQGDAGLGRRLLERPAVTP